MQTERNHNGAMVFILVITSIIVLVCAIAVMKKQADKKKKHENINVCTAYTTISIRNLSKHF